MNKPITVVALLAAAALGFLLGRAMAPVDEPAAGAADSDS